MTDPSISSVLEENIVKRLEVATEVREINHYVPKAEILASIVDGAEATALCGVKDVVGSRSDGTCVSLNAPICPACEQIYRSLPE